MASQYQAFWDLWGDDATTGDADFHIHGTGDERKRVSVREADTFPYNTICQLYGYWQNVDGTRGEGYFGTGFLVSRTVVLTAGHCLRPEDYNLGRRVLRHRIIPALSGDLRRADPRRKPALPSEVTVERKFFRVHRGSSWDRDFGMIALKSDTYGTQPFHKPTTFMPLHPIEDYLTTGAAGMQLSTAGYPGDRPGTPYIHGRSYVEDSANGTMYRQSTTLLREWMNPHTISYDLDIMPGQSGSPLWLSYQRAPTARVVGIVTKGYETEPPNRPIPARNWGVMITPAVIRVIRRWCRELGVDPPAVG